jgi:hypothetical protein
MAFTSGPGAGAAGPPSCTAGKGAATVDVVGRGAFAFFFAAFDTFLTTLFAAGRVLRLTFRPRAAFFRPLPTPRFAVFFFFAMRVPPIDQEVVRVNNGFRPRPVPSGTCRLGAGSFTSLARTASDGKWFDVERRHHTSVNPAPAIVNVCGGSFKFVDSTVRHSCRNWIGVR